MATAYDSISGRPVFSVGNNYTLCHFALEGMGGFSLTKAQTNIGIRCVRRNQIVTDDVSFSQNAWGVPSVICHSMRSGMIAIGGAR